MGLSFLDLFDMISSFVLLGKGCLCPAMTEVVINCPLMILPKAFLLGLVSPHYPAMQRLIELASSYQALMDPMVQARTRNIQRASQFGRPPFIW
jgi:hypothetical protein